MLSYKSEVGKKSESFTEKITQEDVRHFCAAIGIQDQEAVPPTFLTRFRRGEFDLFKQLGISLSSVLHAEQEYFYEEDLKIGDQVSYYTELTYVLEKVGSSSSLQFLTFETKVEALRQNTLLTIAQAKTTIVIREKGRRNA